MLTSASLVAPSSPASSIAAVAGVIMSTEPAPQGLLHTARCSMVSNKVATISAGMDGVSGVCWPSACAATRPTFRRSAGCARAATKGVHAAGSASKMESTSSTQRRARAGARSRRPRARAIDHSVGVLTRTGQENISRYGNSMVSVLHSDVDGPLIPLAEAQPVRSALGWGQRACSACALPLSAAGRCSSRRSPAHNCIARAASARPYWTTIGRR